MNIKAYEAKISAQCAAGKLHPGDLVVIHVDRQKDLTYPQAMSVNVAPTLTTTNKCLWVLSVHDVLAGTPDSHREFFRMLHPTELLALQGLPCSLVQYLGYELTRKAAGNAYPPPLIMAVLHPLLESVASSQYDLASWPPAHLVSSAMPPEVQHCLKSFRARPKLLPNKKKLQRGLKRPRDSDSD